MKNQLWLIKDIDGEYITVNANDIQYGGNGLSFFVNKIIIAHFSRWASFRRLPPYINLPLEEQEEQQTGLG